MLKFEKTILKTSATLLVSLASISSIEAAIVAHNQASDESNTSEIIVVGKKKQTEVFKEVIVGQFNASGGGRQDGQYARFASPICPSVAGFSERHNTEVETRIREIAVHAGIRVAPLDCMANLSVVAVENGPKAIRELRQKRRGVFASMRSFERDKLMASDGPVYSWKTIRTLSAEFKGDAKFGRVGLTAGIGSNGMIEVGGQRTHTKSKLLQTTVEGIGHSYLLIENSGLSGITASQLGDYAAMMSLIDMKVSSKAPPMPGSILALFNDKEPEDRPKTVSASDLFLLSALYKAPRNLKASGQRSAMLHMIAKKLKNEQ